MLSVLIADDHYLIRRGVRQLLEDELPLRRVDEASDGLEALAMAREQRYDLIILDISMPGREGIDIIRDLKDLDPEVHILVLSIQPEEQYALRAFRLGASGCLNKSGAPEELVSAVKVVVSGRRYLSPKAQELLLDETAAPGAGLPHERLSDREFQVFRHLSSGKTIGEISELLGLSVKTVSTYRSRVLEKMGMDKHAQLVQYAFKRGLAGKD